MKFARKAASGIPCAKRMRIVTRRVPPGMRLLCRRATTLFMERVLVFLHERERVAFQSDSGCGKTRYFQEDYMLTVSESVVKELDEFFKDKEKSPIRVYLAPGGCSGPRLGLALDKPGEDDESFDRDGYSFCISKDLAELTGDISINLSQMGFVIDSANSLGGGGCGGCGSSGGCCSS